LGVIMNHITKEEYLSAFVDGEAGSFEEHQICDQLLEDELMRKKLSSFALIGESIRDRSQEDVGIANPAFLSSIQHAIADDEPLASSQSDSTLISLDAARAKKKRRLPKQAFGYAVAASVAAVAAISFQNFIASSNQQDQQIADASLSESAERVKASTIMPTVNPTAAKTPAIKPAKTAPDKDYFIATAYKAPDPETRGMMDKYVAHHLQYASSSTLMPRVRAVSYSTDF